MGVRGELFSARVKSKNDRRTYFFNVKENRNSDVFVTVVESKKTGEGEVFDRHQVVVFEEDLHLFRKGLEAVLEFLESRDSARRPRRRRPDFSERGDRHAGEDSAPNAADTTTGADSANGAAATDATDAARDGAKETDGTSRSEAPRKKKTVVRRRRPEDD